MHYNRLLALIGIFYVLFGLAQLHPSWITGHLSRSLETGLTGGILIVGAVIMGIIIYGMRPHLTLFLVSFGALFLELWIGVRQLFAGDSSGFPQPWLIVLPLFNGLIIILYARDKSPKRAG